MHSPFIGTNLVICTKMLLVASISNCYWWYFKLMVAIYNYTNVCSTSVIATFNLVTELTS